jgi:hypothetical protein
MPPPVKPPVNPYTAADRVAAFLHARAKMRHLDPVQITAAHSDPTADHESPLLVDDLHALVDAVAPGSVTMYLPYVYDRYEGGPPAHRPVRATLTAAKASLDAERARKDQTPLEWADEFGGASATVGNLVYDVVPVEVMLP